MFCWSARAIWRPPLPPPPHPTFVDSKAKSTEGHVVKTQPLGRVEVNKDICLAICKLHKHFRALKKAGNKMVFDEQGSRKTIRPAVWNSREGGKPEKKEKDLFNCPIQTNRQLYSHPHLCTQSFWEACFPRQRPLITNVDVMSPVWNCVLWWCFNSKKAITALLSYFQLRIPVEKVLPCGHPAVNEFPTPSSFTVPLPHPHITP